MKTNPESRKRILIVEDDPIAVDAMQNFLEQWYEVCVIKSARAAVALCRQQPPDVVIMDLMMPGEAHFEGDSAIRQLSKEPQTAGIPVIIQTGFSGGETLNLRAIAPNVHEILIKPIDLTVLRKKIVGALAKGARG